MANCYRYFVNFVYLILLKFCISLPLMGYFARKLENSLEVWADLDFKFRGRFFDWMDIPVIASALTADRGRKAFRGNLAPNPKLCFVDRTCCHLHNFMRPYRPLVVNFISRVDEPFWTQLKAFNDIARRMSWMVDFLTVVIGCGVARSKDDWTNMLNTQRSDCLRHHYCLHDRKVMASFLVDAGIAGDLVYDTPSNEAERQYAAMPERIYVIYKRIIVYDSRRGGAQGGYKVQRLYVYLWKLYRNVKTKDARHSAKERERIKCISTKFRHNDPRNPNNVKTQDPCPDREDESGSGESGLSVVVGDDSSLAKSPGPSILKNKSSGADSINSESMSTTDAFSAFTGESSVATEADSSSDSANSPAASK